MTVKELIAKLSEFPPDAKVVVRGFEGGYDNVSHIEDFLAESGHKDPYNGEYEQAKESTENPIRAVFLEREYW